MRENNMARHMGFWKRLLGLDHLDEMSKVVRRPDRADMPTPPDGYRIYTTEYDEVLRVKDLFTIFVLDGQEQRIEFEKLKKQFEEGFAFERLALVEKSARLIRGLVSRYSQDERNKTVVSLLIDHSGSMKGNRIISALLAAEAVVALLQQCGVRSEVIGFTTATWQGGQSRKKWLRRGRSANPGRLCDLRYILYMEADESRRKYAKFGEGLYPGLLKENVDGEALQFALSRLASDTWERRAVVIMSDGAPVDDSTLHSNKDERILIDHLKFAEEEARREGVALGHVLLTELAYRSDLEVFEYGYDPLTTGEAAMKVLWQLLDIHFESRPESDVATA
jgi:cobaltochelatase CobT